MIMKAIICSFSILKLHSGEVLSFFCKACVDIRAHAFIMKRENDGIKIGSIKSLMEDM
jgi:hypothetical protein